MCNNQKKKKTCCTQHPCAKLRATRQLAVMKDWDWMAAAER